ncbi:hypothetical protein D3C78_1942590 [compost metagenome]
MAWADGQGLTDIRARLEALAERFGQHWQPAALIRRLADSGQRFADFQQEA